MKERSNKQPGMLSAKIAAASSFAIALIHLAGTVSYIEEMVLRGLYMSPVLYFFFLLFLSVFFACFGILLLKSQIRRVGVVLIVTAAMISLFTVLHTVLYYKAQFFWRGWLSWEDTYKIARYSWFGFEVMYPSLFLSLILIIMAVFCFRRKKADRIRWWPCGGIIYALWSVLPFRYVLGGLFGYAIRVIITGGRRWHDAFDQWGRPIFSYQIIPRTIANTCGMCLFILLFLFFLFGYRAVCLMPDRSDNKKKAEKENAYRIPTVDSGMSTDEIIKLKYLLDSGVISAEEFERSKTALLQGKGEM